MRNERGHSERMGSSDLELKGSQKSGVAERRATSMPRQSARDGSQRRKADLGRGERGSSRAPQSRPPWIAPLL